MTDIQQDVGFFYAPLLFFLSCSVVSLRGMHIFGKAAQIVGLLVPVIVVLCVIVIAATAVYWLLTTDADDTATDATRTAELIRMQATAKTYFARLNYYDGVCEVVGLSPEHRCIDGPEGYAVQIPLAVGGFYCADATDFHGRVDQPIGREPVCLR